MDKVKNIQAEEWQFNWALAFDLKSLDLFKLEDINLKTLKKDIFFNEITPSIKPKKVLIAEDDLVSKNMMIIILKKYGFEVTAVENGNEAVSAFENERFDLILMDINMPYLDGYSATALIRLKEQDLGIHTPIIAMTAYALRGDKEKCLASGMDDYLSKPVNINEVVELICKYVKNVS